MMMVVVSLEIPVQKSFGENKDTVHMGCSRLRISLPVFVAREMGLFEKNGLQVDIDMFDTAQPLMDALCGGKIDVAGYTALPITFSAQLRSGKDLLYATLLMEDAAHPISMIVVKKGSTIDSIQKLKGKTIGILPTYAYRAWLELILGKNQIGPEDVTIQHVAPAMTPSALESGLVDAVFTNDPAVTTSVRTGTGALLFTDAVVPKYMWSPLPFASFNMTREFAQEHPEAARKIVRSLDEAIVYIAGHQREAKKIMARFLPEAQKPFVDHYPDSLFVVSSQVKDDDMVRIEEAYRTCRITKGPLNVSHCLYR